MPRSSFLDFALYFIFLLQWMCVSTRIHNDDCSSISIIFYVACFFFRKGKIFLSFSLTLLHIKKFFFWSHTIHKKEHLHMFMPWDVPILRLTISNEFLHFFILYILVHEEFYILLCCVRFSKIYLRNFYQSYPSLILSLYRPSR